MPGWPVSVTSSFIRAFGGFHFETQAFCDLLRSGFTNGCCNPAADKSFEVMVAG